MAKSCFSLPGFRTDSPASNARRFLGQNEQGYETITAYNIKPDGQEGKAVETNDFGLKNGMILAGHHCR